MRIALVTTWLFFTESWLLSLGLDNPRVTLEQGALKGKVLTSRGGRDFYAFLGIPYAKPPLGQLRFKPPVEVESWSGERAAVTEGKDCSQIHFVLRRYIGSEDCLYLNVYTPQLEDERKGLCVMFWVHGGGFYSGSGSSDLYGPEFLLDHDIVLVTFNYRLGPLGFLSLGTPETSGNYGLKDQVAALQWVQKNIAKFGGNPECVTIFGESAGGASIHYLMLSPSARGLFHRAIVQSGSVYNPWALQYEAKEVGLELARKAECTHEDEDKLLMCLQNVEASKLAELGIKIQKERREITLFVPSLEPVNTPHPFLTEEPREMLARGDIADVPLMAGLMTHEGMLNLLLMNNMTAKQYYTENHARYVPARELGLEPKSQGWIAAWLRMENFYSKLADGDFVEQFLLLTSDAEFNVGVDVFVRQVSALHRNPVFYYQFSYDGGRTIIKKTANIERKGTCHADELAYLFSQMSSPWEQADNNDLLTIDRITKLWTDFAITGNPTPKSSSLGVQWLPVEAPLGQPEKAKTRYLNIDSQLSMKKQSLNAERMAFWQQLHLLFGKQSSTKFSREEL